MVACGKDTRLRAVGSSDTDNVQPCRFLWLLICWSYCLIRAVIYQGAPSRGRILSSHLDWVNTSWGRLDIGQELGMESVSLMWTAGYQVLEPSPLPPSMCIHRKRKRRIELGFHLCTLIGLVRILGGNVSSRPMLLLYYVHLKVLSHL